MLRFENLSGDASLDWVAQAIPTVVTTELTGSRDAVTIPQTALERVMAASGRGPAPVPGISAERGAAVNAGATRIVYGSYALAGGKLQLQVYEEDPKSNQTVRAETIAPGSVIAGADRIARQLSGQARPYGTPSDKALQQYLSGVNAADAGARQQALESAIALDPNYGAPYLALIAAKAAAHDPDGAKQVVAQAEQHRNGFSPYEGALLEVDRAQLNGDAGARQKALGELAKLDPGNAQVAALAAQSALAQRDFSAAVARLKSAAAARPRDPSVWNELAYTQALAGDRAGALESIRKYQSVAPQDLNPLDSEADIDFYFGDFTAAEGLYRKAHDRDPKFGNGMELYKAAVARLTSGDIAGANRVFDAFLNERKQNRDGLAEFRRAEWLWVTGRRREGVTALENFAAAIRDPRAAAIAGQLWAEAAVWRLSLGEHDQAVADLSHTNVAVPVARVARFILQPSASAQEWNKRAEQQFSAAADRELKQLALAYALLFDRRFAEAAGALEHLRQSETPSTMGVTGVMLAWAYRNSGREAQVKTLVERFPTPNPQGFGAFSMCWFPRIFQLRGEQGKFTALSGPDRLIWDR